VSAEMTRHDAALILHSSAGELTRSYFEVPDLIAGRRDHIETAFRSAVKIHHLDAGGDPGMLRRLTEARDLLIGAAS
jgi:hypothetical protein